MKLNNKGMTLIEIIVSIVLISIVLVFLSILLIDVKDINDNSKVDSTYLINKALLTKVIEEDIMNYDEITISVCDSINNIYPNYDNTLLEEQHQASECLKLQFDNDVNDVSYIGLYYLSKQETYVITYIHNDNGVDIVRKTFEFKNYEKYNVKDGAIKNQLFIAAALGGGNQKILYDELIDAQTKGIENTLTFKYATIIAVPMIGENGKDYTITIPYFGTIITPNITAL